MQEQQRLPFAAPHNLYGTPSALPRYRKLGSREFVLGVILMGRSEQYRRFAEECVQIARAAKSPTSQAVLLKMAQVWFRLAQEHLSDAAEKVEH